MDGPRACLPEDDVEIVDVQNASAVRQHVFPRVDEVSHVRIRHAKVVFACLNRHSGYDFSAFIPERVDPFNDDLIENLPVEGRDDAVLTVPQRTSSS